jgi:hypothetical protein
MFEQMSRWIILVVPITLVGFAIADDPKKESPEQRRERLRIAVQAICPVSGESLAARGKSAKLIDPETKEILYVCCDNCLKSKPDTKNLETIRGNFAKAQGHCLVMTDNEVTGNSKHGIIDGHFVFVCCPPCVKKMTASPTKYLAKLDDLYEASLKK